MTANPNKLALKDMSRQDQITILEAWLDGKAEFYSEFGQCWNWASSRALWRCSICLVRATQDEVPWEHMSDKFNWTARDEGGRAWGYKREPERGSTFWVLQGASARLDAFSGFKAGTCDWKDSLQKRPGYEGK